VVIRGGVWVVVGGLVAGLVSGCGGTNEMLGLGKRQPDEFAVYSRPPLSMPPDFSLRPPQPGSGRPDAVTPRDQARQAVVASRGAGQGAARTAAVPGASAGTVAILDKTGADQAEPGIRAIVGEESAILAEQDQSLTEKLMFWRTPSQYGTVVDPTEERRRIQETQALGQPVTTGTTPIIERQKRALLEGIFK
jgi:hypothetical protein